MDAGYGKHVCGAMATHSVCVVAAPPVVVACCTLRFPYQAVDQDTPLASCSVPVLILPENCRQSHEEV